MYGYRNDYAFFRCTWGKDSFFYLAPFCAPQAKVLRISLFSEKNFFMIL